MSKSKEVSATTYVVTVTILLGLDGEIATDFSPVEELNDNIRLSQASGHSLNYARRIAAYVIQ